MFTEASVPSRQLWARYDGSGRIALTVVLAVITLALLITAVRLRGPIRPPTFGRRLVVFVLTLWPMLIVAFLAALTLYGDQLAHDYPAYAVPQSPILPVTLSSVVVTFLVVLVFGRGSDQERLVGARDGGTGCTDGLRAPLRPDGHGSNHPPVLPHPGLWRLLFFAPWFPVELCTIVLLLAVHGLRITRWTLGALGAQFLTFTLWSTIGFGFPNHPLTYLANVVAKLCAFAATWTTLLSPRGRGSSMAAPGHAGATP